MSDLSFNRKGNGHRREYLKCFSGGRRHYAKKYDGYVKCKLVHNKQYSLVFPEQILIDFDGTIRWIQPLYFLASRIEKHGDIDVCILDVDVSHGHCLQVEFSSNAILAKYEDGSCLYRCSVAGPKYLYPYTTGPARISQNRIQIKLHHHTDTKARKSIRRSGEYWSSNWNIQGMKQTKNIAYLYLTPLPSITYPADLEEIAMSSSGKLAFRLDQTEADRHDLVLDVARESTANRTKTLSHWVDSSLLATQPVYRHIPNGTVPVYYEVVCPYIHRIGVANGTTIKIEGKRLVPDCPKNLEYAVIGEASTLPGLEAPYDEEATEQILKVEMFDEDQEIIGFWFSNGNTDQYSTKDVEVASFGSC